jgi:putative transposase
MPETARLNGCLNEIELGFVEREATPIQFMKLGIQLHLQGLSLSNTVSVLDKFGVDRTRSTVHNWVHKADLQPEDGRNPDHVAVDETVIRLNDEQYWLYAAVDPATNNLLHTKLETVRTTFLLMRSSRNSARNTTLTTPYFLLTAPHRSKTPVLATASITETKNMVVGTASNVSFVK